jgi:hypothetical protein
LSVASTLIFFDGAGAADERAFAGAEGFWFAAGAAAFSFF